MYLQEQFRICYDLYCEILNRVEGQLMKALQREDPDWRLHNCCPSCTYNLKDEPKLRFSKLFTMDGNDSMKRLDVQGMKIPEDDEGAEVADLKMKCRTKEDTRLCNESYFLSCSEADKFSKEAIGEMLVMDPDEADENDPSPCSDRWRNMVNDQTSRMWGIYDETGIFVSLCHHGFVLMAADMVRSGEL